jgi:hypothetical protein
VQSRVQGRVGRREREEESRESLEWNVGEVALLTWSRREECRRGRRKREKEAGGEGESAKVDLEGRTDLKRSTNDKQLLLRRNETGARRKNSLSIAFQPADGRPFILSLNPLAHHALSS